VVIITDVSAATLGRSWRQQRRMASTVGVCLGWGGPLVGFFEHGNEPSRRQIGLDETIIKEIEQN
jgi:hypothetical protein